MADLESDLRSAINNGFLHVTLMKRWTGAEWECGYRTTGTTAAIYVQDKDPVEAMRKALRAGTRAEKEQPTPVNKTIPVASVKPRRDVDDLA